MKARDKIIAVDFDGTIYDAKKKEFVEGAVNALRKISSAGYILILWTCRSGNRLKNALNILDSAGLKELFLYVNETPEFVNFKTSNKACAFCYIDDRNIGGFIGWRKIMELLKL